MADAPPIVLALGLLPTLHDPDPGPPAQTGTDVPPISVELGIIAGLGDDTPPVPGTDVPPIVVSFAVGAPEVSTNGLVLVSPDDQATVRINRPTFLVRVLLDDTADDDLFTVELQYADNSSFTNPVTMNNTLYGADDNTNFTPTSAIPDTTYWRARLKDADATVVVDWTPPHTVTVDTAPPEPATLPVTWTVSASAPRPIHLWHLNPPGPIAGETVTAYGQGFPASGHLFFGDELLDTVTSWTKVAASSKNTSGTRAITGSYVTPEHYEVVFTAPVYNGPGAPLTVEA